MTFSSWKEPLVVSLGLLYSGNLALQSVLPTELQLIALALLFFFLLLRQSRQIITLDFLVVGIVFASILCLQCVAFSFCPIVTISGFFVRLFIGYALIRLVKNFPYVFVKTMVYLTLLSFLFFVPYLLLSYSGAGIDPYITQLANILGTGTPDRRPLFVHTFVQEHTLRNAGMFWEPGAFQGYLILALIFLAIIKKRLPQRDYLRSLIILSTGVLSTLSTTGFIVLFLIPLLHYNWPGENRHKLIPRVFLGIFLGFPLLAFIAFSAYQELPFLGEKIDRQLAAQNEREAGWHRGRIGSFEYDWAYIEKRPLTGWGLHSSTRYSLHPWMEDSEGMGNGFSDFTVKFGAIGFLTWFVAVFRGFWHLFSGRALATILTCAILLLELQGECFLGYPLFLSLAFLRSIPALRIENRSSNLRVKALSTKPIL